MAKEYIDYIKEQYVCLLNPSLKTAVKAYAVWCEKGADHPEIAVWFSPQDTDLAEGKIYLGDSSHPEWPDKKCGKSDGDDFTPYGYQPGASVPLGRLVACRILGVRHELLLDLGVDVVPLDDCHLNMTRRNIGLSNRERRGDEKKASAVSLHNGRIQFDE